MQDHHKHKLDLPIDQGDKTFSLVLDMRPNALGQAVACSKMDRKGKTKPHEISTHPVRDKEDLCGWPKGPRDDLTSD